MIERNNDSPEDPIDPRDDADHESLPDGFLEGLFDQSGDDKEASERLVALVSTIEPLLVHVDEIEDERTPEGMICMGSFIEDRLIARSAVPRETLDEFTNRDLFAHPVRIALAATAEDPGLQCQLFALLPAQVFQEEPEPDEPWAASVPHFESGPAEEGTTEDDAVVPVLLGHIIRFERDRRHPEDLAAEAADVLKSVLDAHRPLQQPIDKILDDLLGSED